MLDTTRLQGKRMVKEYEEKRFRIKKYVDSRFQVQLDEDGGDNTRQRWMKKSDMWTMTHWE